MGKHLIIMGLISILMFSLTACGPGNGNGEDPEETTGVDQPQPVPGDPADDEDDNGNETGTEIYTVEARLIGLADSNSAELEIIESEEYHFEQELNVFRFGEEVIVDFNEGVYDVDEILTLYITIEQGEDYNIYTIERAQTSN